MHNRLRRASAKALGTAQTNSFWASWGLKLEGSLCPDIACGKGRFQRRSSSIWTHFGGNLVSPKWIMKNERDICVVTRAASLRRLLAESGCTGLNFKPEEEA